MSERNGRPRDDESRKPARDLSGGETRRSVAEWTDTYTAARVWVDWTARRRWPDHPTNDDVWALSVADWWHGCGGRDD